MDDAGHSVAQTGRRSRWWWLIAAALLIVGAVCLAVSTGGHHPLASPITHQPPPAAGHSSPAAAALAPALARSVPVSLRIPAIGISVSLSVLGLNATRTVQVPTDYQQPGWYDLGPSPGQMGSAVILGHVDTYVGPAVFFRLRTLVKGDKVVVTLADGVVANFNVDSVATYVKAQFPAQEVYGTQGHPALQLVTCGGTFDTATGHYLSNVVVYTTLVTTTSTTAPGAGPSTSPAPTPLTGTAGSPAGTPAS